MVLPRVNGMVFCTYFKVHLSFIRLQQQVNEVSGELVNLNLPKDL